MTQLPLAALQPASVSAAAVAPRPSSRAAERHHADPPERSPDPAAGRDREPAARPQRERTSADDRRHDETRGDEDRRAEPGTTAQDAAAAEASRAGGREAVVADDTGGEETRQPFATLLAAQIGAAVEVAPEQPASGVAAAVQAAIVPAAESALLPGGKTLPPGNLEAALQRHVASLARQVGAATSGDAATTDAQPGVDAGGSTTRSALPIADLVARTTGKPTVDLPVTFDAALAAGAGDDAPVDPRAAAAPVQAAAGGAATVAPAATRTVTTVEAPLGEARWAQAFGEKVTWLVREGSQLASMRLDPPQLGPVDVRVSVSNGEATLSFVAGHASVRDAIESALPRLREMLGEQGLALGNVDVSGREPRGEAGGGERAGGGRGSDSTGGIDEAADAVTTTVPRPRAPQGLLDRYA